MRQVLLAQLEAIGKVSFVVQGHTGVGKQTPGLAPKPSRGPAIAVPFSFPIWPPPTSPSLFHPSHTNLLLSLSPFKCFPSSVPLHFKFAVLACSAHSYVAGFFSHYGCHLLGKTVPVHITEDRPPG